MNALIDAVSDLQYWYQDTGYQMTGGLAGIFKASKFTGELRARGDDHCPLSCPHYCPQQKLFLSLSLKSMLPLLSCFQTDST
jgi:hypothetical protein